MFSYFYSNKNKKKSDKNKYNIIFLVHFLNVGLSIIYSSAIAIAIVLRGRINTKRFNLSNLQPFRIRRIPL